MKLMQQSKGKFHCENFQGLFELHSSDLSLFFSSFFPLPWYVKCFLIAHTYFSVINNGFLIKVIICVPARSTVPTHGFWTDVRLGKLRSEGSMEFGEGWVGNECWSGFSIEICGSLLIVYSTKTKAKNAPISTRSRWEGPKSTETRSQSLAGVDEALARGLVKRCSQCAHFPAPLSFER